MIFDNHVSKMQDSWAFGCFLYKVLTNSLPFDLAFIYNKDSRDDEHLIQLFSLLRPLPAKLKNSWPRYGVYFDTEGQLKRFVEDDDKFSYAELENLPEDDCRSITSDAMDNRLPQENDEAFPIALPDHLRTQECFDPEFIHRSSNFASARCVKTKTHPNQLRSTLLSISRYEKDG